MHSFKPLALDALAAARGGAGTQRDDQLNADMLYGTLRSYSGQSGAIDWVDPSNGDQYVGLRAGGQTGGVMCRRSTAGNTSCWTYRGK